MACKKNTNDIFTDVTRVSSDLENLDNLEISGNFDARREKLGNFVARNSFSSKQIILIFKILWGACLQTLLNGRGPSVELTFSLEMLGNFIPLETGHLLSWQPN